MEVPKGPSSWIGEDVVVYIAGYQPNQKGKLEEVSAEGIVLQVWEQIDWQVPNPDPTVDQDLYGPTYESECRWVHRFYSWPAVTTMRTLEEEEKNDFRRQVDK